jgi:hypothetical protein
MYNHLTSFLEIAFLAHEMCAFTIKYNSIWNGFLKGVQNLKVLDLVYCQLQFLPKTFGDLKELKYFNLLDSYELHTLLESLGKLKELKYLNLWYCFKLHALPMSLGDLKELKYLHFSYCSKLHALLESLGDLKDLSYFELSSCLKLQTLPKAMHNLHGLKTFNLKNCHNWRLTFLWLETWNCFKFSTCQTIYWLLWFLSALNICKP